MSGDSLTEFEALLLRFNAVANRLKFALEAFPKRTPKNKNKEGLQFFLQEQIIINLQSLAEARATLIGLLKSRGQSAFEQTIRDLWLPIARHVEAIAKLRNRFVAHTGHNDDKVFRDHPLELIQAKQFPTLYAEVLFLALCAFHYILFLQEEFKAEREAAEGKWKKRTVDLKGVEIGSLRTVNDVLGAHKAIAAKVRAKVEGAGYTYHEPAFR